MKEDLKNKMQTMMYALTKEAARSSFSEFREDWGISDEDYILIKKVWAEKLGIKPYC